MTSLDEVIAFGKATEALRQRAFEIAEREEYESQQKLWLKEVVGTIKAVVPTTSYLQREADALGKSKASFRTARTHALELLDAVDRQLLLNAKSGVSDDFKRAVEIAVKDGYFENWPFKFILIAASALLAILAGGTILGTYQTAGILRTAEVTQKAVHDTQTAFEGDVRKVQKEIQDRASNIDDMVRKAVIANNKELAEILEKAIADMNAYVVQTKSKLDARQTEVLAAINADLRNSLQAAMTATSTSLNAEAKRITDDWNKISNDIVKRGTDAATAIGAEREGAVQKVTSARDEAVRRISTQGEGAVRKIAAEGDTTVRKIGEEGDRLLAKATTEGEGAVSKIRPEGEGAIKKIEIARDSAISRLNAPAAEVEDKRKVALSSIENAREAASNNINTYRRQVEGRKDESVAAFEAARKDFVERADIGKQRIATELQQLPAQVTTITESLRAIDTGLGKYQVDLARIVTGLAGDPGRSRLMIVIDVLAWSFWIAVGAAAAAVIAIFVALWAILSRRETEAPAAPPPAT